MTLMFSTISETWFNASVQNKEYNVDGYKLMRLDRHSKTGGGVCLCSKLVRKD